MTTGTGDVFEFYLFLMLLLLTVTSSSSSSRQTTTATKSRTFFRRNAMKRDQESNVFSNNMIQTDVKEERMTMKWRSSPLILSTSPPPSTMTPLFASYLRSSTPPLYRSLSNPSQGTPPLTNSFSGNPPIVGYISFAMSFYIPIPSTDKNGNGGNTNTEKVSGLPPTVRHSFLKGPLTQWVRDFVCAPFDARRRPERTTRLISIEVDDDWDDKCMNPLPLPPTKLELILGYDPIDLDYTEHEISLSSPSSQRSDGDQNEIYSSWNWTFPVHQWGEYHFENYDGDDSFLQSKLDEQISTETLSVELPWKSLQISVLGSEIETFGRNSKSNNDTTSLVDDNNDNDIISAVEGKIMQIMGGMMLSLCAVVVTLLTYKAKTHRKISESEERRRQTSSSIPSTTTSTRTFHLDTAEDVDRMLFVTNKAIEAMPSSSSSSSEESSSSSRSSSSKKEKKKNTKKITPSNIQSVGVGKVSISNIQMND